MDIYLIANANPDGLNFLLPYLKKKKWYRFVDTSLPDDLAITDNENFAVLVDQFHYFVKGRSVVVLVGQ